MPAACSPPQSRFSTTGGTTLLAVGQLIAMMFFVAVETNNVFVAAMRGHGSGRAGCTAPVKPARRFVVLTWFWQLVGSFAVILGLPSAGLASRSARVQLPGMFSRLQC